MARSDLPPAEVRWPASASIFISELRLPARVGVNPGERGAQQPIVLDIEVGVEDMGHAASTENLKDTLDYVGIARAARRVVERRHYPLVETLASSIASEILERTGAVSVRVRLRKLHCLRRASAAGVEVEMHRDHHEPRPRTLDPSRVRAEEDVVVVGGGAAGLAAALWCWRLGHPALLVDPSASLGGQLHHVHGAMTDLPGMPPMPGLPLSRRLVAQFIRHGGRWLQAAAVSVEEVPGLVRIGVERAPGDGPAWRGVVRARAAVLAMGIRRRELGVPGERELLGRGVLHTGARDTALQSGRRVVVLGGGDAACENALILARAGARVVLVHRGERLTALDHLARPVRDRGDIEVRLLARVRRFAGTDRLEAVELEVGRPGAGTSVETIPADAALVRVGWEAISSPLPRAWLDERGFARVEAATGRVAGTRLVFAAGDLAGPTSSSVASAFGSAATAVRAAVLELERGGGQSG